MADRKAVYKNDPRSNPEARGRRLRSLRKMTDLSRKEIAEKYQLSAGTLQGWEDGRYGGLTEKGAKKVLKALRNEGIQCSLDWLMFGIGLGPQISEILYLDKAIDGTSSESDMFGEEFFEQEQDTTIREELLLFRHNNKETIDIVVDDDAMSPFYNVGDYIAGRRRFGDEIQQFIGNDCIVQTKMGDTFVRRVRQGSKSGLFTLISLNTDTIVENPTIYNVELMSAAPVVWIRRKETILVKDEAEEVD